MSKVNDLVMYIIMLKFKYTSLFMCSLYIYKKKTQTKLQTKVKQSKENGEKQHQMNKK